MSAQKLWSLLAVVVTWAAMASSAQAQHFQPFVDPEYFNPDFQFFAPAEVDYFGDPEPLTTGWFFTYDRLYWGVTRANNGSRPWDADWTWGNRFDIGYMTEDDGGWLFSTTHLDGPNSPTNQGDMSSVEFNKVFRLEPLHHNGVIEPMLGVRYVKIEDFGDIRGTTDVRNQIVLGQLGVRAWKNVGKWKVAGELRGFAGGNWQMINTQATFDEFVPGGEARAEMQYNLTRDVALRVGWELLYFGDGVCRNNNVIDNTEDMLYQGVTFGFTVNR